MLPDECWCVVMRQIPHSLAAATGQQCACLSSSSALSAGQPKAAQNCAESQLEPSSVKCLLSSWAQQWANFPSGVQNAHEV